MTLSWIAADLLTGNIITDLAGIELTSPLVRTIGQQESVQLNLHVDATSSPDWLTGTTPAKSTLIAYTGSDSAPTIVWGGVVIQRVRDTGPVVQLGASTVEAYLDGCQMGAYTASALNQDTIVAGLMAYAMGTNRPAWTLNHVNASTQTQSATYTDGSQTSVYAALQALSALHGGPEWTCGWAWDVAAAKVTPTLTYGSRIGQAVNAGAEPNVTVESRDLQPGSAFHEDYSPGLGANLVVCYGAAAADASSTAVPSASAQAIDLKGRPLWAYAYSPNQTVTDTGELASYATQALTQMADGAQPLSMVLANNAPGKQLGVDWNLGDDLGWHITGPAFPQPVSGVARCVSYQADYATITPIMKGASLG